MVGPSGRYPSKTDYTIRMKRQIRDLYAVDRKQTNTQNTSRLAGGATPGAGGSSGSVGNYLETGGGSMDGPIGFDPVDIIIVAGQIDIGQQARQNPNSPFDHSTYVLVTGAGTPDDLNWINGARFAGQLLILQGTASQVINIIHATTPGTDGNIVTSDGNDIVLDGTVATNGIPIATFIFDITVTGNGAWRLVSVSGSVDLLPLDNVWTGINTFTGTTFNVNSPTINLGDAITDEINFLGRVGSLGIIPIAHSTTNLGASGKQWNTLWIDILQNATTVAVQSPNFAINSSQITLGDAITDEVSFLGRVGSLGIIPIAHSTTNLGASGKQWNTLWIDILTNATTVAITSPNFAINSSQITLGDAITDEVSFLGRVGSLGIIPIAHSTTDLGASGRQWNTLWIDILQNATTVAIQSPNFAINSSQITLGDAITDEVSFLGRVGSLGIIPIANSTTNLGTSGKQWNTLWIDILTNATTVAITSPNFAINSSQITLGDAVTDDISFLGQIDREMVIEEIASPSTPPTNTLSLYGKLDGGFTKLFYKQEDGTEVGPLGAAGGGGSSFLDNAFEIVDNITASKKFVFAAENLVGTNTITAITTVARTWTLPDVSGTLVSSQGTSTINGLKTFSSKLNTTGDIDVNTNYIRFDGMAVPSTITGEPLLFANSSNSDHLSIKSGDGSVYDLEHSGAKDVNAVHVTNHSFDGNTNETYYSSDTRGDNDAETRALSAVFCYFIPFVVPGNATVTEFALHCTATTGSPRKCGFAIYDNSTDGKNIPGTRIVSVDSVLFYTTGGKFAAFSATGLSPGLHWLAVASDDTGVTVRAWAGSMMPPVLGLDEISGNINSPPAFGWYLDFNYSSNMPTTAQSAVEEDLTRAYCDSAVTFPAVYIKSTAWG